jgi:hypothetical protein
MAAEYRGFDFGRKADIAWIDRRKRLKNHDVVFNRRGPFETLCGPRGSPPGHAIVIFGRRNSSGGPESLFAPWSLSRIKQCQCVNRRV